jgi:hypothetical protein
MEKKMRRTIQQMRETNDSGTFNLYEIITDLEMCSLTIELKVMNSGFASTKKILYFNNFTDECAMFEAYQLEVGKLLEEHYLRDMNWLVSQLYSYQDFISFNKDNLTLAK